jgi:hypothetical protein
MSKPKSPKEAHDYWFGLFQRAFDRSAFDALCTLLRPCGMHDAGWDILDESAALFDDFNRALKKARDERAESTARRLALH